MGAAVSDAVDCNCKANFNPRQDQDEASGIDVSTAECLQVQPCESLGKELLASAKSGRTEQVKALLLQGVSIDSTDKQGRTALHLAVANSKFSTASLLVESGADKEAMDLHGKTPFLLAVAKGNAELSKLLIRSNAKIETKGEDGRTALQIVSVNGDLDIARLLLGKKANVDAKRKNGSSTALSYAVQNGNLDLVRLLLQKGARLRTKDKQGLGTKLFDAMSADDLEMTEQLLMVSASTTVRDNHGLTPLLAAVSQGRRQIGEMLASTGISKHEITELGKRLLEASGEGNLDMVTLLISCSACIEDHDCFNETPIWKASFKGHNDVVRLLLQKTAKLEIESRNCCRTPLVIAIDRGHAETVKLLLGRGACLPRSAVLERKLRDAARFGKASRAQVLLECRAQVNSVGDDNETPLHKAAESGKLEVARILLEASADLNARAGKAGRTPMEYTASGGSTDMLNFLKEFQAGKFK